MPADKQTWSAEHTSALLHAITALVLAHRVELYRVPELAGVAHNHGSAINQHTQRLLRRLCAGTGAGDDVVRAELAKVGRAGKRQRQGSEESASPTKKSRRAAAGKEDNA